MAFSPTDAAFEGFRLVRRNPLALVAWTLLYAVLSLGSLFAMSNAVDQVVALGERSEALEGVASPDPAEVAAVFEGFGGLLLSLGWLLPISILVGAMLAAAVARGVLNPRTPGFGYLRLGMDELRVVVVTVVLSILMVAAILVLALVVGVAAALGKTAGAGVAVLVAILVSLAGTALIVWLTVRLSLAVPITVAEKRIAIFDSFSVTKGRFWPLLGMAILAFVMVIVITLLSSVVTMPLNMMSGLETWSFGAHEADPAMMRSMFDITNPWVIASALAEAVVYALTVGVMYAPFAAAYRDIKGLRVDPEAFD